MPRERKVEIHRHLDGTYTCSGYIKYAGGWTGAYLLNPNVAGSTTSRWWPRFVEVAAAVDRFLTVLSDDEAQKLIVGR